MENMQLITKKNLDTVLKSGKDLILFFYITNDPASILGLNTMNDVNALIGKNFDLYLIDAESEPEVAEAFSIKKIPEYISIKESKIFKRSTDLLEVSHVLNLLKYNNVSLVCGDIIDFEYERAFDVIYSSLTFMHIKEKKKAIEKMASLLNDSGLFVLSLDKSREGFIDMGSRRIKIYPDDPNEIRLMLADAGMTVTERFETELACVIVSRK